jgi:Flp pilus assembly protein TadG
LETEFRANWRTWRCTWGTTVFDARGSQIVEFAVSLPLIAVFLIGIFDFSQAFGLKQKLCNAARDGARVGSNQPTADLSSSPPPTVQAIAQAVGQYLQTAGVTPAGTDCGLGTTAPVSGGNLIWTVTATGCTNNPVVTINRGFLTTATMSAPYPTTTPMTIENTQVTVQYPFQWRFGNVVKLLVPGTSYAGTTTVSATATMQNLN